MLFSFYLAIEDMHATFVICGSAQAGVQTD